MFKLSEARSETLDPLFLFLNYFDTDFFFLILISTIWLGFSYRWGIRIFYWLTTNNLIIYAAKYAIGWSRPNTDFFELGMVHPTSNGFPSGAAMNCMFLGALLICKFRTKTAWVVALLYILLISFSRLYLGVHYPIDILGGWLVAVLMLFFFLFTKEPLENFLKQKGLRFSLALSLSIPLAIVIAVPKPEVYFLMGATLGIGIGIYFSLKYHLFLSIPKNMLEAIGRSFVGVAILFLILFLTPGKNYLIKSLVPGFFMSLAVSPICRWLMQKKVFQRLTPKD